jgi:hypothetical protein
MNLRRTYTKKLTVSISATSTLEPLELAGLSLVVGCKGDFRGAVEIFQIPPFDSVTAIAGNGIASFFRFRIDIHIRIARHTFTERIATFPRVMNVLLLHTMHIPSGVIERRGTILRTVADDAATAAVGFVSGRTFSVAIEIFLRALQFAVLANCAAFGISTRPAIELITH